MSVHLFHVFVSDNSVCLGIVELTLGFHGYEFFLKFCNVCCEMLEIQNEHCPEDGRLEDHDQGNHNPRNII